MSVRDVALFVKVFGRGYPLLLMHGGPGLDHTTLLSFRRLADQFTLIFFDHRCNGRSDGMPVSSMTWENLTADADALRQMLGFDKWAILGHSFGGMVALEYALRYPDRLSHLVLLDTGGDTRWSQQNAPELLARRGFSAETVETVRRFFNGQIEPDEMIPSVRKFATAYYHHLSPLQVAHELATGLRMKSRPEALIFAHRELYKGWTVMDRLGEIRVPTLVMAGRDDFLFPPEHQAALAAGIPNARLEIVERAGHNPHAERTVEVVEAVRRFIIPETTSKAAASEAIATYLEQERQRLKVPGISLAIVEGDEIVDQRGFGWARPHGEVPTAQTPFFIGSLTKSVTALAVMQLVETGKVELDAPVQRYLPWFRVADPQASAQMTVRHLLNQTNGLPTWCGEIQLADFDENPTATERQARALSTLELTRPVGTVMEYSNANYNLLGLIIEAASGESYAEYLQAHIFSPLGMRHTFASAALARQHGLAVGHQYWFGMPVARPTMPLPHGALPGGLLISSAEDMARYLIAHLNGGRLGNVQILSEAGINELQRGAADFNAYGRSFGKYGMGWFVDQVGGRKLIWHSGILPDFFAYMALLPEQKKGIVLLFNADQHWMVPALTEVASGAMALLAGQEPAPSPVPFARLIPWMLRALLLIPILQMTGVLGTWRLLRRWDLDPGGRPGGRREWGRHLLLPLFSNLLVAHTLLRPMMGKRRGYLRLYMPDISLIALISGGFALLWGVLRSVLVLQALRRWQQPKRP